jgi:hypothetical protein
MTTRARLLTLLAVLSALVLALVGAGCGDDEGGGGGSEDPKALLEKAFAKDVDSGELKVEAKARLDGVKQLKGPLSLDITGPFKSNGKTRLPSLDWDISVAAGGRTFSGGLVTTKDNAFLKFQGQTYEVGGQVLKQYEEQQRSNQGRNLKSLGIDPASWLKDPELKDGQAIGGDSTRLITGSVDVEKVIRDFFDLLRSPAFRKQLERQGQSPPQIDQPKDEDIQKVKDAIEELKFEANVDGNDVARRLFVDGRFTVPEDADAGSLKGGQVSFGYTLEKVGGNPTIQEPANAKPLSELLQRFGLGGALGGGGSAPLGGAAPRQ